jgi:hypothetical protein
VVNAVTTKFHPLSGRNRRVAPLGRFDLSGQQPVGLSFLPDTDDNDAIVWRSVARKLLVREGHLIRGANRTS